MSNKLYEENDIQNIANAIRNKNGTEDTYKVSQMSTAIDSIEVIEQATAEGESLSLTNTKAMPYSDYVVEGKSEQATSILPEGYTQVEYIESTGTQYIDTNYVFKSNDNIFIKFMPLEASCDNALFGQYDRNNTCEFGFQGGKLRGNIGTGGPDYSVNTIYEVQCINGRWSYNNNSFGDAYNNNATNNCFLFARYYNGADKLSKSRVYSLIVKRNNNIILQFIPCYRNNDNVIGLYDIVNNQFYTNAGTGTFLKGNNVTMPSPEYPSKIHSVADDVNLFDTYNYLKNNAIVEQNGMKMTRNDDGTLTLNGTTTQLTTFGLFGGFNNTDIVIPLNSNENYTLALNASVSSPSFTTYVRSMENGSLVSRVSSTTSNSTFSGSTGLTNFVIQIPANTTLNNVVVKPKIQKGTVATPYSPYNQGTVTIKQRGKNLWNEELENAEYDTNGNKSTSTNWLVNKQGIEVNPNTTYTVSQQQTPSQYRIIFFNNNTYLDRINNVQNATEGYKNYTFTTPANCNKIYIQFRSIIENINQGSYVMIPSDITNIQLEQGSSVTTYELYQGYDKVFQTEPLRSLPNGVKYTIEADGIHRRVGRYILPEIATLSSGTVLGTQCQYAAYSLSNSKTGGRNYNFISNKIAPANENFLKYGAYRNQKVLIVMTSSDDTVENFNSKISGSEVLYELAEEIIEPLTQNQATTMLDIIKTGSYEGTTNIYTDEDVKPTIGVEYYKKS